MRKIDLLKNLMLQSTGTMKEWLNSFRIKIDCNHPCELCGNITCEGCKNRGKRLER